MIHSYITLSFLHFSYKTSGTNAAVSWGWLLPVPISVEQHVIAKKAAWSCLLENRFSWDGPALQFYIILSLPETQVLMHLSQHNSCKLLKGFCHSHYTFLCTSVQILFWLWQRILSDMSVIHQPGSIECTMRVSEVSSWQLYLLFFFKIITACTIIAVSSEWWKLNERVKLT